MRMGVTAERVGDRQEVDRNFVAAQDDDELVAQVRAGNDAAFEAIYDRYARGVLSFCRHMLGGRDEAEDALQVTFVSAYRGIRKSDGDISLRPWLFTIARNRCLSELRSRREVLYAEGDLIEWPGFDGPADLVQRREDLREMFEDMQRLPADQRAALVLFELGDHSHTEIAAVLGVRGEKVKALIFQAREALARGRIARNTPCEEVRERLSTVRGKILPRSMIRAHIDRCPACAAFESEVRHQRVALSVILPVALAPALKATVLGSVFGGGHAIVAAAASRGTGVFLNGGRAGAQGGTAAGAAGAAGTTGAASTTGTVVAGATTAGGLATTGGGAYAAGVVVGGPAAALATDLAASGGGAAVASALAGSSATGMMVKMAIAAIAIATGAVGTILGPRVIPGLSSIVSGSHALPAAVVVAPANSRVPVVSGSALQGSTLTTSGGSWTGSPGPSLSYQWEDCDSGGANCSPISGATLSTYVLGSSDVGSTVAVVVTAGNASGSASAVSPVSGVVAGAPTNSAAPAVSGSALQGSTLIASDGTWSGSPSPTFSYQWQRCDVGGANCSPISGATSSTYVLGSSDVGSTVDVVVTGGNGSGSASAASSSTGVVSGPPANSSGPSVSGPAAEGATLSASDGSWNGSPAPTFSYQWENCDASGSNCSAISGATSATYVPGSADVGSKLHVVVTATNSAGSSSARSSATSVIAGAPVNSGVPVVSGSATQGGTLATSDGSWSGSPAPSVSYQWVDCDVNGANCAPIAGATGSSYLLGASDVGSTVGVVVTAGNDSGSASAVSSVTGVVAGAPANTAPPVVSGAAVQGGTLTASNGTWAGSPAPSVSYQWVDCDVNGANCAPIAGATGSSYLLGASDVGSTVGVVVTAGNDSGSASAVSSVTGVVAGAPANTAPPVVSGAAVQGGTLTASNGTWAGSPAPSISYQWADCDASGANCVGIPGATSSSYVLAPSDVGSTVVVLVTAGNGVGTATAASSATAVVTSAPANIAPPAVTGTAQAGSTLTASDGTWSGSPAPSVSYQWYDCDAGGANCAPIASATMSSYVLGSSDVGSTVLVAVTAANRAGSAPAASSPTAVVAGTPVSSATPAVPGSLVQSNAPQAPDATGSFAPTFAVRRAGRAQRKHKAPVDAHHRGADGSSTPVRHSKHRRHGDKAGRHNVAANTLPRALRRERSGRHRRRHHAARVASHHERARGRRH